MQPKICVEVIFRPPGGNNVSCLTLGTENISFQIKSPDKSIFHRTKTDYVTYTTDLLESPNKMCVLRASDFGVTPRAIHMWTAVLLLRLEFPKYIFFPKYGASINRLLKNNVTLKSVCVMNAVTLTNLRNGRKKKLCWGCRLTHAVLFSVSETPGV